MKITSSSYADIRTLSALDLPFISAKVTALVAPGASSCCSLGSCTSSSCGAISVKN